jgi:hypothetical protein
MGLSSFPCGAGEGWDGGNQAFNSCFNSFNKRQPIALTKLQPLESNHSRLEMTMRTIPAGEFKTHCLRIMDDVNRRRQPVLNTKKGVAVAKLVPRRFRVPRG